MLSTYLRLIFLSVLMISDICFSLEIQMKTAFCINRYRLISLVTAVFLRVKTDETRSLDEDLINYTEITRFTPALAYT